MKILIYTVFLFYSGLVFSSERLCPVIESKGEGHWPMSEDMFTKENADSAILNLQKLISDIQHDDFKTIGASCASHNNSVIVKGYLIKREVSLSKDSPYYKNKVSSFCNFIKQEAYTCH